MSRIIIFIYGLAAYVFFLGTFLYAICFVANILVPRTIDSGVEGPLTQAIMINVLLLGLFAIQHSVMARQGFKKMWTKIVPVSAERSTYVLLTSVVLSTLFHNWSPMLGVVWSVENPIAYNILFGLSMVGWLIVFFSTFMIDHFDLFGLRQIYLNLRGKEYSAPEFKTRFFYKKVRHPLYTGFIIAFWATPHMSMGHLMFAFATTAYMLIAIQLEERDLVSFHGEDYKSYRQKVSMLIPLFKKN